VTNTIEFNEIQQTIQPITKEANDELNFSNSLVTFDSSKGIMTINSTYPIPTDSLNTDILYNLLVKLQRNNQLEVNKDSLTSQFYLSSKDLNILLEPNLNKQPNADYALEQTPLNRNNTTSIASISIDNCPIANTATSVNQNSLQNSSIVIPNNMIRIDTIKEFSNDCNQQELQQSCLSNFNSSNFANSIQTVLLNVIDEPVNSTSNYLSQASPNFPNRNQESSFNIMPKIANLQNEYSFFSNIQPIRVDNNNGNEQRRSGNKCQELCCLLKFDALDDDELLLLS
jgi:hypothetical protein